MLNQTTIEYDVRNVYGNVVTLRSAFYKWDHEDDERFLTEVKRTLLKRLKKGDVLVGGPRYASQNHKWRNVEYV